VAFNLHSPILQALFLHVVLITILSI